MVYLCIQAIFFGIRHIYINSNPDFYLDYITV